ncbi:MAG TPA: metallopeptidase family protein [Syntrophales bacterium]|jgi:predicted Zn-dependent protease with MMP-like domain|nr:metallopeptidase family protein [Syntrophales bacterium]HPX56468.1 metallopeptidase family protein [Syntrophales bacterium]
MKLTEKDFDQAVQRAIDRIPAEIREHLENVSITVQKRASREMLKELGMTPDDPPLGLYEGASLPERSILEPPLYPDTIFIFQEPLEQMCRTREELEREIEITVVHEIAHFFGIDDERLAELGYD